MKNTVFIKDEIAAIEMAVRNIYDELGENEKNSGTGHDELTKPSEHGGFENIKICDAVGDGLFWVIGKAYFIRTVTMHSIGKLESVSETELLLSNAVWVADSGRFNNALKTGDLDEVEPFINDVIINRTAVIDATEWTHDIPDRVIGG